MTSSTRSAPRRARSASTTSLVSSGAMGRVRRANVGPASISRTSRMIVTPVSVSPAMIARCTGAAPRYFGSSEGWMLMVRSRGAASTASGSIRP
ncbi:MAG: hypothetical protein F4018_07900 [Acidobacteria bacterium]|nr:hypothetical protein [Acidobacteriota bacterium]